MQGPKQTPDKQNPAKKAQGHLSKQSNAAPKVTADTVLERVEQAQKQGGLNQALQNEYNKLIQNADGRVFVDPKSGLTIIVKNIKLQGGKTISKVFVKAKDSPDAVELQVLTSNSARNYFVVNTKNGPLEFKLYEGKATLEPFPYSADQKQIELLELRSKADEQEALNGIRNYLPPDIKMAPEYAGRLEDGRFFVVTAPKGGFYEGWRVYIGQKGNLKEYKATDVSRLRDGGTTFIEFAEGLFYFPSPNEQPNTPVLRLKNGQEVKVEQLYGPGNFRERLELSKELNIPLQFKGKEVSIVLN